MQVTLNQHELKLAVKAYLDKIMAVPLSVIDLDIKGMRTSEGYTATVDVILNGQEYIVVPAQSIVETIEPDNTPMKRHFDNLPELTEEESKEFIEILNLVANNPRGVNDKEIYSRGNSTSSNLWEHLHKNESFMLVHERVHSEITPSDVLTALDEPNNSADTVDNSELGNHEDTSEITSESDTDTNTVTTTDSEPETNTSTDKFKVQTGVNLLGEPIIEELSQTEIDERTAKGLTAEKINDVKPKPIKAGMFS